MWDKHLREELRLKRVVALLDLPSDLAALASRCLDVHTQLPPISDEFPTSKKLEESGRFTSVSVTQEKGVEHSYEMVIARHCLVVAATLAYKLPEWSSGCLQWGTEEYGRRAIKGIAPDQAVADGRTARAVFKKFNVLAIWEFKNLNFSVRDTEMKELEAGFLDREFTY
ncbi:hypothetical protein H0H87_005258 [Tephrocybe sp. NHM501043]|nr:hypothetical protein H0H87_005258 [Tephrocybe sp. NHM501043]